MKCFNHEQRDAVAACQRCGKGLCKECASKYTPCLCESCFQALRREDRAQQAAAAQRRRESRLQKLTFTRNDLIISCVLGVPLAVYTIYMIVAESYGFDVENILVIPWMFCMPAGWRTMSKWIRAGQTGGNIIFMDTDSALYLFIAHLLLRLAGAMFLGIPAFLFQVYKVAKAEKEVAAAGRDALPGKRQ